MSTRYHTQLNQSGAVIYMTATVIGWRPVFIKHPYLQIIIQSFIFFQNNRNVRTIGYCIMPNHIHWIFKLPDIKPELIKIIRTFKSYTASQCIKLLQSEAAGSRIAIETIFKGLASITLPKQLLDYFSDQARSIPDQNHRFWQPDSDVRLIQRVNVLRQKLAYIHSNPTQNSWRLVETQEEYPYSSCRYYEQGSDWYGLNIEDCFS